MIHPVCNAHTFYIQHTALLVMILHDRVVHVYTCTDYVRLRVIQKAIYVHDVLTPLSSFNDT